MHALAEQHLTAAAAGLAAELSAPFWVAAAAADGRAAADHASQLHHPVKKQIV